MIFERNFDFKKKIIQITDFNVINYFGHFLLKINFLNQKKKKVNLLSNFKLYQKNPLTYFKNSKK